MRIPRGFSDELRNQADILRIIGDYVTLKKKGNNYWACCPFHQEKTPSFSVNPSKLLFKCFGCGKGGGIFDFIMEIEGCSFPEAVKIVADKAGVPVPVTEDSKDFEERDKLRADLARLNQLAAEFFERNLNDSAEGRRALDYLDRRGITAETRKFFGLGYAPNSWDALGNFLRSKGVSRSQIERSGLVTLKENSTGFYDRFRGRLMFPIRDTQGRIVAFGGRIIGEGEPKYLNSPETALYTKGQHLFGLHYSREAIRQKKYVILVEGYLDFLVPFQAGVRNLVASLGTALTETQVRLLGRYTRQIVVNFDPDSAGVAATKRSLESLLAEGFKVNVLSLPDNLDPDEYIRAHGAESYLNLLRNSQNFIDYIVEQAVKSNDLASPAGKVETVNAILPYLKLVRDKIERAGHFERIADRLKIDSKLIREEFGKAVELRSERIGERAWRETISIKPAERKLLELLLQHPAIRRRLGAVIESEDYEGLRTSPIFRLLFDFEKQGLEPAYPEMARALGEDALARDLLQELIVGSGEDPSDQDSFARHEREALESLHSLRCSKLAEKQAALQADINRAQRDSDPQRLGELMMQKFELAKRERALAQWNGQL